MTAICYLTLIVIVVARWVDVSEVILIALFAVVGGMHLRSWARRIQMGEWEQLFVLGGIIAQVILLIF